jgi:hypothetical protein
MILTPEIEVPGHSDGNLAVRRFTELHKSNHQGNGTEAGRGEFDQGPPVAPPKPVGPRRYLSLPVLSQILIAQVPVLPQLQGREQHHDPAKT